MTDFIWYIFKAGSVFTILYAIYWLSFRQLTFHWLNRVLLVLIIPCSLILPVLNIGVNHTLANEVLIPRFDELYKEIPQSGTSESVSTMSIGATDMLFVIYCIGLLVLLIRFVISSFKLISLKKQSVVSSENGLKIIYAKIPMIFSCFNWVFVPEKQFAETDSTIIEHERLHFRLWHTTDLILTEIFVSLFWFHPFAYLFRKSIKSIHEYQVDALIVKSNIPTSHYLKLMLQNIDHQCRLNELYNYFNGTTIKNRIKMITKNKSSKLHLLRYFLLIPAISILTWSFTSINAELPKVFPIKSGEYSRISANHGDKLNPFGKEIKIHNGIDIVALKGTNILATAGGIVIKANTEEGWGKLIIIDHGNGVQSWYAHLNAINVKEGASIEAGQIIGIVGSTGKSTGPHLHFEIRINNTSVDPMLYVK